MKRIYLIAGTMMALCFGANAQTFQLGVKGGVNISNFSGSSNASDVKENSLVGFHAGAFLGLGFGKHFSIQPEVLVSSQGAKLEQAGHEENFRVTYVNIPVLAKYRFDNGFYLEAGPQIGFNVSEDGWEENFNAKSTDLSAAVGLGFHSNMGLGIGARYTAGLSTVNDFDWGTTKPDYKNSVIQVSVFYTLFNRNKE